MLPIQSYAKFILALLFIAMFLPVEAQVFLDENQLQENHFPFEKADHSDTDWWQEMNSASPEKRENEDRK